MSGNGEARGGPGGRGLGIRDVVVVEAQETLRASLERDLRPLQIRVLGFATGRDALVQLRRQLPDVLLIDVNITPDDGFVLCKQVRELPGGQELPILITSEVVFRAEVIRSAKDEYGFSEIIFKPYSLQNLLTKLRLMTGTGSGVLRLVQPTILTKMPQPELVFLDQLGRVMKDLRSGALQCDRGEQAVHLFFRNGKLVTVDSGYVSPEEMGQELVRRGLIADEELTRLLQGTEVSLGEQRDWLGRVLIESGRIRPEQLAETLTGQAAQRFKKLFGWRSGTFRFKEGESPNPGSLRFNFSLPRLIFEGLCEFGNVKQIQEMLERYPSPLRVGDEATDALVGIQLSVAERRLLRELNRKSLKRALVETGVQQDRGSFLVMLLLVLGVLESDEARGNELRESIFARAAELPPSSPDFPVAAAQDDDAFSQAYGRAYRYMNLGLMSQAEEEFARAVLLRPADARALCYHGWCRYRSGEGSSRFAAGMELVQRALVLDPGLATAHVLRGKMLMEQSMLREAQDAFLKAMEVDPGNDEAMEALQALLRERHDKAQQERLGTREAEGARGRSVERPFQTSASPATSKGAKQQGQIKVRSLSGERTGRSGSGRAAGVGRPEAGLQHTHAYSGPDRRREPRPPSLAVRAAALPPPGASTPASATPVSRGGGPAATSPPERGLTTPPGPAAEGDRRLLSPAPTLPPVPGADPRPPSPPGTGRTLVGHPGQRAPHGPLADAQPRPASPGPPPPEHLGPASPPGSPQPVAAPHPYGGPGPVNFSLLVLVIEEVDGVSATNSLYTTRSQSSLKVDIIRHLLEAGGTLEEYRRDRIVCLFGYPFDQGSHRERALRLGLSMREVISRHLLRNGIPLQNVRLRAAVYSGFRNPLGPTGGADTALGEALRVSGILLERVRPWELLVTAESVIGLEGRFEVARWEDRLEPPAFQVRQEYQQTAPTPLPWQPQGQPGMGHGQPEAVGGQPGMAFGQPGMPFGQPGIPFGQPGMIPQGQPGMIPQGQPGMIPQGQPGMGGPGHPGGPQGYPGQGLGSPAPGMPYPGQVPGQPAAGMSTPPTGFPQPTPGVPAPGGATRQPSPPQDGLGLGASIGIPAALLVDHAPSPAAPLPDELTRQWKAGIQQPPLGGQPLVGGRPLASARSEPVLPVPGPPPGGLPGTPGPLAGSPGTPPSAPPPGQGLPPVRGSSLQATSTQGDLLRPGLAAAGASSAPPAFDGTTSLAGRQIGNFTLLRQLGKGGMGRVYEGVDRDLGRKVAVKIMNQQMLDAPGAKERFREEARALARINCPQILQIYSMDLEHTPPYLVLEFVDGSSLRDLLAERQRLPWSQALEIILDVARGLRVANERGIVHRDINPRNLMLTRQGEVKIADFGLAKSSVRDMSITIDGAILGTPLYMSPEQWRSERADFRSDIYSLGITLFQLIEGTPPFDAENVAAVMLKHLSSNLPLLSLSIPQRDDLMRLLRKMTAKDLTERYSSYQDLLHDVGRLLDSAPGGAVRGR